MGGVEVVDDLPLVPDVIAGGQHIAAKVEKLVGDSRCNAEPAGRIFRISDHQVDLVGLHDVSNMVAHNLAAGAAENISNKENLHKVRVSILPSQGAECASEAVVRKS